jgi:rhodanese-related sulfurtransferase
MAATAERITPQEAHDHIQAAPPAILVCAYDTEEEFQQNHLEGALRLKNFASQADAIPKDQEIIFYCA